MFRIVFCIFLSSLQLLFSSEAWIHLELGAGNYGESGDVSQNIPEKKFDPHIQYKLLFWTLDELVDRQGEVGVFQVNDINESYLVYTLEKLKEYAEMQGYDQIIIEGCPGDYFTTNFSPYLEKHGRKKYDSIHLKNPEGKIYAGRRKPPESYAKQRQAARDNLQKLANWSQDGLYFFTLYHGAFFPDIEKEEFVDQGIFYLETDQWEAVDYYFPHGDIIEDGRVFFIQSRSAP